MPFATFHLMIACLHSLQNSAQCHLFRKLSLTPLIPFVPRTPCRMLSEHCTVWMSCVCLLAGLWETWVQVSCLNDFVSQHLLPQAYVHTCIHVHMLHLFVCLCTGVRIQWLRAQTLGSHCLNQNLSCVTLGNSKSLCLHSLDYKMGLRLLPAFSELLGGWNELTHVKQ